jgi:hypothetical protein
MQFLGPVFPATAILFLFAGALPNSAGAQDIAAERLSAIVARTPIQPSEQPKQLRSAERAALHQAVRGTRAQRLRRSSGYTMPQRVAAAVVMGFAGFYVGGKFGAAIEGNCGCDDPGLKGFLIGAPIGAAAGATLGIVLTR